ncbi:target of Nesh-SH3 isoform X9 [Rhinatrema bivittatum]|uniref:target of Nesh-SH3 isoform X9 n=1 Tax=Rhinatrema bivittatum TaxID=194408 RepID=UPI00112A8FF3|nr:target of Nesh-SH3 isoform X9 [Rhinatrema bivittatum]
MLAPRSLREQFPALQLPCLLTPQPHCQGEFGFLAMLSRWVFLLLCGNIAEYLGSAQKLPRAKRQSLKVQINATGDTIAMKFLRPNPGVQLEGFILGYGSSFFSSQYIPLPANGKSYETEVDAEPRYLIAVRPAPTTNPKKSCSGKNNNQKPLQVVVGNLTPTSVFMSWGILINPQYDWTVMNNCPNDRFYTVRYREKDKNKKWLFQLCPTTETVVDNLRPNTMYEFGVKDNSEDGVWNKGVNHKIDIPSTKKKENGQIQNTYKVPRGQILMAPEDMKKLIPIQVIKQVIQNITNSKHFIVQSTVEPSPPEAIPGQKEVPEPVRIDVPESPKPTLAATRRATESIKSTASAGLGMSKVTQAHGESKTDSTKPDTTLSPELSVSTRATIQTLLRPLTPEDDIQSLPSRPRPLASSEGPSTEPVPHNLQYAPSTSGNSEMPEIAQTESVANSPDLETSISLTTSIPQVLGTTLAINDTYPLPTRPKTSEEPDISETIPAATIQTSLESVPSGTLNTLEWVGATMVSNETPFMPSKYDQSASPETQEMEPVISTLKLSVDTVNFIPAATYQMPQEPAAAETSTIPKEKKLTMAPIETRFIYPHPMQPASPETNPVTHQTTSESFAKEMASEQTRIILASTDADLQFTPSESSISSSSEKPQAILVAQRTPEPLTSKTSIALEQPIATPVREYSLSSATPHVTTEPPLTTVSMPSDHHRTTLAAHGMMPESLTTKPSLSLEQPRGTLEGKTVLLEPSAPKTSKTIEQQSTTLAARTKPQSTKASAIFEPPRVTLAPIETHIIAPRPKVPASSEKPQSKPAAEISAHLDPVTSAVSKSLHASTAAELVATSQTTPGAIILPALTDQPAVTLAVREKPLIPSILKASVGPEMSHTKPVKPVVLDPSTTKAEPPRTTLASFSAPKEKTMLPSEPELSPSPDVPQLEPVPSSLPITKPVPAKSPDTFQQAQSTYVPKTTRPAPSKPKPSSSPGAPQTKPAPKMTQWELINLMHLFEDSRVTLVSNETQTLIEPETTQMSESPHTKTAPKKSQWAPINLIRLNIFEDSRISLVPNDTQDKIVPPSSKPRTRPTTRAPHTRAVPIATHKTASSVPKSTERPHSRSALTKTVTEPAMSKLPHHPQRPKATLGPYNIRSYSPRPRPRPSARPGSRPAFSGTTHGPVKPKPSSDLNWFPGNTDGRLAGLDISKLLGVSRNMSMEPNGTGKRPVSVPSSPHRMQLPPVRPTYMRRRPFNNMTGRPGSPGTALIPRGTSFMRFTAKPTQFSVSQKTQVPKKQPTLSYPEWEEANDTVFNPKPKAELDPLGKTRFTAPHVKYMRKEETVPCSITESLKHFPNEESGNQDITSAPQNPPSNLTVVTVEGCPSFVILDWEQPDNDTVTEYEVISKENGGPFGKDQSILRTNQTHSTVENLKPDTSYEFKVKPKNPLGEGPTSNTVAFNTESADPRVSESISGYTYSDSQVSQKASDADPTPFSLPLSGPPVASLYPFIDTTSTTEPSTLGGKDAIWTEISFKSDGYSECKGKQYVKRTWYKKFVGIQLCNSLRYKIYLSDSLTGKFYNIGDERGHGEDHCQFVDSFLDGRTGQQLLPEQLPTRKGYYRAFRQQPVEFGKIGRETQISYVHWYECGTTIPGKW